MTLILTRRDIASLMTLNDYLAAAETAFRALADGRADSPLPMHLAGEGGVFHAKAARIGDHAAIKVNANFPQNQACGMPTIQGAILFADARNGALLAIMDSIEITLQRTAAASALAARHLARPQSSQVAICGCGAQAGPQLKALANVLPLKNVKAWDRDFERARAFAAETQIPGLDVRAVRELKEITNGADVIVTCTTAGAPFLTPDLVGKGAFIAAVGADNPDKSEIAPELIASSKIVTDVLEQCVVMGDLHHAIRAGRMTRESAFAELAEVVSGRKPGRTSAEEIIIFDSTGTAVQDVAAAAQVYTRALEQHPALQVSFGAM
jgi:alanine dehydrogenase